MFDEITQAIVEKRGLTKVFLDYDGTLVDLVPQPELAVPDKKLLDLLNDLKSKIPLYLITGRDLDGIVSFVGYGFNIVAMHGSEFMDESGKRSFVGNYDWVRRRTHQMSIKYSPLEKDFPGLRVIDKKGGLQFHYYNVNSNDVKRLERAVSEITEEGFEMYSGKYVYELRVSGMDKGKAMMKHIKADDFILFAGDDKTDEEAFRELEGHVTVKVGEGDTLARFRLESPSMMKLLLAHLLKNKDEMFRSQK